MNLSIPDKAISDELIDFFIAKMSDALKYRAKLSDKVDELLNQCAMSFITSDRMVAIVESALTKMIEDKVEKLIKHNYTSEIKRIASKSIQEKLSI